MSKTNKTTKITYKQTVYLLLFLGLNCPISIAQVADGLTIETLVSGEFDAERSPKMTWVNKELGYMMVEDEGKLLVSHHPATGNRKVLIRATNFTTVPSKIIGYRFSQDQSKLMVTLVANKKRTYWLVNLKTLAKNRIDLDAYADDLLSIKLSPDGKKVAFVHRANIYVHDIGTTQTTQLTHDGSDTVINANASFPFASVHNTKDYRWSPNSGYIAYNQFDTTGVPTFKMINNTNSLYPEINELPYVKPGETLPSVRIGVVDVSNGTTTWLDMPGDPRNNYIYHLTWKPNSNALFVQQLNRNQNTMLVLQANIASGATRTIYTESEQTFLEPFKLQWVNKGRDFVWMSENDGWRHLYKISADGLTKKLITPGAFDVAGIAKVDEQSKWVYYMASPQSMVHRYLFRAKLDGSGVMERLSPEDEIGVNGYKISPSGRWAFRAVSRFDEPPTTTLIGLPDHRLIKVFEDNKTLVAKLKAIDPSPVDYYKVAIEEGVSLDAWMIKPPNFNTAKKYPVIFHVYSMPAVQTTQDSWKGGNYLFYQLLAQKGFIVMGIDGRGTPSLQGRAWRKSIYRKHGILPADDIAKATQILTRQHPYMDAERVGVYGWSGGGLMSLLLILRHPDVFNTAVPGAYLSHHKYYHAGFTERFMGMPQDNPEAYEKTAVLNYAKNLQGNLLIMHGTGDDNVHYQNTEALVDKLIEEKKRFTVLPYPNRKHNMRQGKNTKYHQYDTYLWFFSEHLLPKESKE